MVYSQESLAEARSTLGLSLHHKKDLTGATGPQDDSTAESYVSEPASPTKNPKVTKKPTKRRALS